MSHWLSQISSRFLIGQPLLIAVVYDVTGASPDGDRGILILNEAVIATNIINDIRRELIVGDAKKLMREKNSWSDITYPLGEVLSKANGECRVIYQYFDANTNHEWIHHSLSRIRGGQNVWIAFRKGATSSHNSTIAVLAEDDNAALNGQINELLDANPDEPCQNIVNETALRTKLLSTNSEQILLLPVGAPTDPIVIIGHHRVAVETIRFLALLPLSVEWYAEEFIDSDPSGPMINRQMLTDLSFESWAASSAVVVMSNDHQQDLELCERALSQPGLTFVGCIGSARKAVLLKEQLLLNGIKQSQLDKLHIPIGLPEIAGKHPSLIAASVMAQLLTIRQINFDDQLTISER